MTKAQLVKVVTCMEKRRKRNPVWFALYNPLYIQKENLSVTLAVCLSTKRSYPWRNHLDQAYLRNLIDIVVIYKSCSRKWDCRRKKRIKTSEKKYIKLFLNGIFYKNRQCKGKQQWNFCCKFLVMNCENWFYGNQTKNVLFYVTTERPLYQILARTNLFGSVTAFTAPFHQAPVHLIIESKHVFLKSSYL